MGPGHVAAYLAKRDLRRFDPKAPPKKSEAFWTIVFANRAPEDAELADALDKLKRPAAVTIDMVAEQVEMDFKDWLHDRKNRRIIPLRFEGCGYTPVRNRAADDGLWRIDGKRQALYVQTGLTAEAKQKAATEFLSVKTGQNQWCSVITDRKKPR